MELEFASKDRMVRDDALRHVVGGMHARRSQLGPSKEDTSTWSKGSGRFVRATIVVIGGKWKPLIIDVLRDGTLRSGALLRRIPRVSRKVLTAQLRELEAEKVVSRAVLGKKPEHVEYSLTAYGRTLVPVMDVLAEWGGNHLRRCGEIRA